MDKVFTFWEPKESMPGYVKLCIETWARNLPGREIVVLDRPSLGDWLCAGEQAEIDCPEASLAMQADCIRCALLRKHGGIWLDADTILTGVLDSGVFMRSDVTMVARRKGGHLVNYGAYIHAAHPGATIIEEWHRQLLPRIRKYRRLHGSRIRRVFDRRGWKEVRGWDYFENAILDPMTAAARKEDYDWIDKDSIGAFPEESLLAEGKAENAFDAYVRYWFSPGDPAPELENCAGLIMLHNSWTPARYREMSEEEILHTDTRLAQILREGC